MFFAMIALSSMDLKEEAQKQEAQGAGEGPREEDAERDEE